MWHFRIGCPTLMQLSGSSVPQHSRTVSFITPGYLILGTLPRYLFK
jgi:hypothetical protein